MSGERVLHAAEPRPGDSSRPSRAAASDRTRRSRASGDGQAAISAPSSTIPPPIQIHDTSGETIVRKVAVWARSLR